MLLHREMLIANFDSSDRKKAECQLKSHGEQMILKLLTRRASKGITVVTLKKPMVRQQVPR